MFTDRLWKPFVVSQKFLDSAWCTSSPFTRLPTEVLIEIFNYATALDQLALALACKHLLQVSTFVSLKTSCLVGVQVSVGFYVPIGVERTYDFWRMDDLLRRVKPLNKAGRPQKAWHICIDCMQFRPTRKSYWKRKRATGLDMWDGWVTSWNLKDTLQCPECRSQEAQEAD